MLSCTVSSAWIRASCAWRPRVFAISYSTNSIGTALESLPPDQTVKALMAELLKAKDNEVKLMREKMAEKDVLMREKMAEKDVLMREKMAEKDLLAREKDKLAREKDKLITENRAEMGMRIELVTTLSRAQQMLSKAMFAAGVTSGRAMMDYVQKTFDPDRREGGDRADVWKRILDRNPEMLKCIAQDVKEWKIFVRGQTLEKQQVLVANKIAGVHGNLSDHIHDFVPGAGLVIYEGVPTVATTVVLRCIAKHCGIPYEVQASLASHGTKKS